MYWLQRGSQVAFSKGKKVGRLRSLPELIGSEGRAYQEGIEDTEGNEK